MLKTKLQHLKDRKDAEETITNSQKLIICAGRWGPMCIPVYRAMERLELEEKYNDIVFRVTEFDTDAAKPIREAEKCRGFMALPFTVYCSNNEIVHATSGIQSKEKIEKNIEQYFS